MDPDLGKPDSLICPQQYCFHWLASGADFAPGLHANLEASLAVATRVDEARCGCGFGTCIRLDPTPTNRDWYEPHEPNLAAASLPWFFFIPDPFGLPGKARKRYINASERLWGKRHWQQ